MIIIFTVLAILTIIVTPLLFMLLSKRKERTLKRHSAESTENLQEDTLLKVDDPGATGQETTETFELFNPDDRREPEDRNPKKHFK
ncbi:MAG: hypothetical protein LCH52_02445 [Bacteroidetes bacterium]|nr:hypothetical protein [Bacteroidota bacterium]